MKDIIKEIKNYLNKWRKGEQCCSGGLVEWKGGGGDKEEGTVRTLARVLSIPHEKSQDGHLQGVQERLTVPCLTLPYH